MPPTSSNGKICYLEVPSEDVAASAAFYHAVFGWQLRHDDGGSIAFDDGVGEVSGMWVTGRPPALEPGLVVSIMVDDIVATAAAVVAHGGGILREIGADAPELTAWFSDPAGNVLGLYQERGGDADG